MKYRSRMEIIRIILEITSNGATKTKIMYNAYLSYAQLCEYISFLVENKLINRAPGSELYRLTEKGQKVYLKCKELGLSITPEQRTAVLAAVKKRAIAKRGLLSDEEFSKIVRGSTGHLG